MKLLEMVKNMKIKHSVSVSPPPPKKKMGREGGRLFSLKRLRDEGGRVTWGLISDHARREKSFTNAVSSNLKRVNLKIFPGQGGRHT